MEETELIEQCQCQLDNAEGCLAANDHTGYCARMSELLHLLMDELVGSAPGKLEVKVIGKEVT